jgi:phosphomethylpyrimidine synthase
MDLSTGKHHETRVDYPQLSRTYWDRAYLSSFEKVNGIAEDLTWEIFRDTLIEQGMFLHYSCRRVVALYSFNRRTGHRNCSWRIHHGKVVFVSSFFIPILKTFAKY